MDSEVAMDSLLDHCLERFEAGGHVARREARLLSALAGVIAADLRRWADLTEPLDLGGRFDPALAAPLILEMVFDEVLDPSAWRLLSALLGEALA